AVPSIWLAGTGAVSARVGGATSSGDARASVTLTMEGRTDGRALAAAGDAVALSAPKVEAGWRSGEVTLDPDELRADDRRPFAVRVVPPASVTIVQGADLGPFLTEALAVLVEGGQVRRGGDASGAVRIGGMTPNGAGVVFPPADPVALGAINRALAAAGVHWRFGVRVEGEDTITAPLVPELAGARVMRRYRLEPRTADADRDVLARAGGEPWLVREGRAVVVGSRAVPEETNLPLLGVFVPFVDALVNRIARGEAGILEAAPGDPVELPAHATALGLAQDSAQAVESGAIVTAPRVPGVYALLAGADTAGMLVVAPDPRESDLRRADAATLRARFKGARVTLTGDASEYGSLRFRGAGRSELTGWLLAGVLLVLLVEAGLATGGLSRSA
ncbi:MAG: hypothetical protein Q7J79_04850, partial [Gemmatimonadales bacterium]|nr:hypothetical protein [Gemmatimonadales bacterium]